MSLLPEEGLTWTEAELARAAQGRAPLDDTRVSWMRRVLFRGGLVPSGLPPGVVAEVGMTGPSR